MKHEEAKERREAMSRAWGLGFKIRTIAKMFRVTMAVVQQAASQHRALFPHRIDCHDLIVNRRVSR